MKSKHIYKETKNLDKTISFPVLAKFTDKHPFVVLFCEDKCGTVVWTDKSSYEVGHYSDCWNSLSSDSRWQILPSGEKIVLEN